MYRRVSLLLGMLCCVVSLSAAQPSGQDSHTTPEAQQDRITLHVKDADIAEVLKFLSLQRRVNIVAGKEVSGTVSVNLYDIPFETALRVILQANGLAYYRQEDVIFVTKAPEGAGGVLRPVQTTVQTFRLNYANIDEVADMVRNLMSPTGKIVIGKGSKTLLLEETADVLTKIAALIQSLDVKPRQVLIEAKILEVTLNNDTVFGFDWSALFGQSGLGGRLGSVFTQGFATNPAAGAPGFFFSVVDENASVLLSALQERGNLNTLANPKILAVNGEEAQILIGAKLGFRVTTTTETSTTETVEFLDVGTELVIKPLISDDGYILMNVHPKVSDGKVELGLPSETTTEATTSVLMKDGATMVIGGLIREREEESRSQVPGLGDLPLVGALFRRRTVSKSKTEIAVLITPHIMQEPSANVTTPKEPVPQRRVGKIWDGEFVMALSNSL